jgi:biopolymer transport protein ExbB
MDVLIEKFNTLWAQATAIWLAGGWVMVGIAVIALVMFALGLHVHLKLRGKGFQAIREKTWRRWIDHPIERQGPIGDLLDAAMRSTSLEETAVFFEELRATEIAPFARDEDFRSLDHDGNRAGDRAARAFLQLPSRP